MRVLALCFVAFLQSQVLAAPTQWPVSSGGNNHFYEYIPTRLNWESARSSATSSIYLEQPGYLASITSTGENDFVRGLIADAAWAAWLGGSDLAAEDTWTWADGPEAGVVFWSGGPVGYNNFAEFEPNNLNNEDAVAMWGPNGGGGPSYWGQWNDFQASDTQGFVVEYAVPEPAAILTTLAAVLALSWYRAARCV